MKKVSGNNTYIVIRVRPVLDITIGLEGQTDENAWKEWLKAHPAATEEEIRAKILHEVLIIHKPDAIQVWIQDLKTNAPKRALLLVGPPGSGKTSKLREIGQTFSREKVVYLSNLPSSMGDTSWIFKDKDLVLLDGVVLEDLGWGLLRALVSKINASTCIIAIGALGSLEDLARMPPSLRPWFFIVEMPLGVK